MCADDQPRVCGALFEMVDVAAEKLNFTYHVKIGTTYGTGVPTADGRLEGIIGVVNRSEADLGAAYLGFSPQRARAVTYLKPYWYTYVG